MSEPPVPGSQQGPRLGAMFGRYRIESVIGRGGMGSVFLATDTSLDRPVALKLLALELVAGQATQDRFVRESRLAAAIEHPHIVPVYEAGHQSGALFIAMRYVPGPDLARVLRREAPLDVPRTLRIGEQLADALDAAHRRGLVHRDVKPANVLIEDRGGDWAWLTDFGLTLRADRSNRWSSEGLAGTLDYIAPESIEHGQVDGRADQYSLACLLVHCLTGAPPFERGSEASVLYAHLHDEPVSLVGRVAGVDEAIDGAIRRALAKRAEDRFPDCRTFHAAMHGAVAAAMPRGVASGAASAFVGAPKLTATVDPAASHDPPESGGVPASAAAGVTLGSTRAPPATPTRRIVAGALIMIGVVAGSVYLGTSGGGRRGVPDPSGPAGPGGSPSGAPAGLAGLDGVMVFAADDGSGYDIWAALPDGSGLRQLTEDRVNERMPDVAPDGSAVVFAAGPAGRRNLYLIDADGSGRRQLTSWPGDEYAPAFSPDGTRIAFASDRSGDKDIWVMTHEGQGFAPAAVEDLTDHRATDWNHADEYPAWFPDGRRIAFSSNRASSADIWVVDIDAERSPMAWTRDDVADWYPTVGLADQVVFSRDVDGPDRSLFVMMRRGDVPGALTDRDGQDMSPDFSPDGGRLVFARDGVGRGGARLIVSSAAGKQTRVIPIDLDDVRDPAWVSRLGAA